MKIFSVVIIAVLLSACSTDSSDEVSGVIPEHQLQALEKAQGIEAQLKASEQQRLQQMNDQEEY